jgi:hypothetical protein
VSKEKEAAYLRASTASSADQTYIDAGPAGGGVDFGSVV